MKNSIDVIAQRIFASFLGLALFTFAIGTVMNNSAKADSPNTVNSTGKIMMSESGFLLNGKAMYHILVWDTETGKSKLYNFGTVTGKLTPTDYQLPTSPIY
jgi:hypothetical protein